MLVQFEKIRRIRKTAGERGVSSGDVFRNQKRFYLLNPTENNKFLWRDSGISLENFAERELAEAAEAREFGNCRHIGILRHRAREEVESRRDHRKLVFADRGHCFGACERRDDCAKCRFYFEV